MAVDVGSIVARLLLDRTEFQRGLTEARAEAAKFSKEPFVAKFSADTRPFDRAMGGVEAAKASAAEPVSSPVSFDTGGLAAGEVEVEAAKKAISRPVEIPVTVKPSLVNTIRQLLGAGAAAADIQESLRISKGQMEAAMGALASQAAAQAAALSRASWAQAGADMASAMVAGWLDAAQRQLGSGGAGAALAAGVYRALNPVSDSTRGPIVLGPSTPNWSWWAQMLELGAGSGGNLPILHGTAEYPFASWLDSGAYRVLNPISDSTSGPFAMGSSSPNWNPWTALLALGPGSSSGASSGSTGGNWGAWFSDIWQSITGRFGGSGGASGDTQAMSSAAYQLYHLRSVAQDFASADRIFAAGFGKDVYKSAADELKKLGVDAGGEGGNAGRNWARGFAAAASDAWKGAGSSGGGSGGGGFRLAGLLGAVGVPLALGNLTGAGTLAGGLFSLGGTAFAGLGSVGVMAYDMYKTLSGLATAQKAYQTAVSQYGSGSSQAASALSALQTVRASSNPAALPLAGSFSSIGALLGPALDKAEVPMYAGLASIIAGITSQAGGIGSVLGASGSTFGGFLGNIGADLKSPIFAGITKSIAGAIPTDLGGLLDGLLHFAEGFGKLVETFQPAAMALAKGFDRLGNSFAQWTLGFKLPKGAVSSMMGLLHTLGGAVSTLASAVGPLASALAPLGGPTEAIILGLAKGVANLVKAAAPGVGALAKTLGPLLGDIAKWLPGIGSAAGKDLGALAKDISDLVRNAPQWYKDATKLPLIGGFFKTLGGGLAAVAKPLAGGAIALGILGLIPGLSQLEKFAGKMFLTSLVGSLKALGTIAWAGIAGGIRAVAASMGIMELSTGWVIAVAAGVTALAVAGYLIITHWSAVVSFLRGPWGSVIVGVGLGIAGLVAGPIGLLIGAAAVIALHWKAVSGFFATLWQDVQKWFFDAWHAIYRTVVKPLEDGASGLIQAWNPIEGVFATLWGAVTGIFTTAAGTINGIIGGIVATVNGAISVFHTLTHLMGGGGLNNIYGLNGGTTNTLKNLPSYAGLSDLNLSGLAAVGAAANTYQNYPGAASGGYPPVGSPFWVGEKGPELMQVGAPTRVWDHKTSLKMSSGSVSIAPVYNVSVTAPGADPAQVAAAVRKELAASERRTVAQFRQLVGA